MPEYKIREYDSEVIMGLPKGQKIKWKETDYLGIRILEEYEPVGTQNLKTEDIIEDLEKVPNNIRKYIRSIVLAPFTFPENEVEPVFASADLEKAQITIYAIPKDRDICNATLF